MAADLIFLILIVGVPVIAIILLLRTVVKKSFISIVFKNLADVNGWKYFNSGKEHNLNNILEDSVFIEGDGSYRLRNILDADGGMYFCDCRYINPERSRHRRDNNYALAVAERVKSSPVFRLLRSHKNSPEGLTEFSVAEEFKQIGGETWSWLLTSSVEAFNQANWSGTEAESLKSVMEPGSMLFMTESQIILFLPGFLYTRKITDLKLNMEKLQQLL